LKNNEVFVGQAILNSLLDKCHDIIHQIHVLMEKQENKMMMPTTMVEEGKGLSLQIQEKDNNYIITSTLPEDIKQDCISVGIHDGLLSVQIKKGEIQEDQMKSFYSKKQWLMSKSLRLPHRVDESSIKSKFDSQRKQLEITIRKV